MWVAILIFVIVYAGIASEKFPRHWHVMALGAYYRQSPTLAGEIFSN